MFGYIFIFLVSVSFVKADYDNNPFFNHTNDEDLSNEKLPLCEKGGTYTLPHNEYCDLLYQCSDGKATLWQCLDGLGYVEYVGCKSLHLVNCSTRPKLQNPKGKGRCVRLNGIFADPRGCGHYVRCQHGAAKDEMCPVHYVYNDEHKVCRKATKKEYAECRKQSIGKPHDDPMQDSSNKFSVISGFSCPDPKTAVFPFGTHSRHPYPGVCRYFIMCMLDGSIKMSGCEPGSAFNPYSQICEHKTSVPGCQ